MKESPVFVMCSIFGTTGQSILLLCTNFMIHNMQVIIIFLELLLMNCSLIFANTKKTCNLMIIRLSPKNSSFVVSESKEFYTCVYMQYIAY